MNSKLNLFSFCQNKYRFINTSDWTALHRSTAGHNPYNPYVLTIYYSKNLTTVQMLIIEHMAMFVVKSIHIQMNIMVRLWIYMWLSVCRRRPSMMTRPAPQCWVWRPTQPGLTSCVPSSSPSASASNCCMKLFSRKRKYPSMSSGILQCL